MSRHQGKRARDRAIKLTGRDLISDEEIAKSNLKAFDYGSLPLQDETFEINIETRRFLNQYF
jgi:hypothetical protein